MGKEDGSGKEKKATVNAKTKYIENTSPPLERPGRKGRNHPRKRSKIVERILSPK